MSNVRYYADFPTCPITIVSAISAGAGIFNMVDAKCCRDGSIILEVLSDENQSLSATHLESIARIMEVEASDVFIDRGADKDTLVISVLNTGIDFGFLFGIDGKEDWYGKEDGLSEGEWQRNTLLWEQAQREDEEE